MTALLLQLSFAGALLAEPGIQQYVAKIVTELKGRGFRLDEPVRIEPLQSTTVADSRYAGGWSPGVCSNHGQACANQVVASRGYTEAQPRAARVAIQRARRSRASWSRASTSASRTSVRRVRIEHAANTSPRLTQLRIVPSGLSTLRAARSTVHHASGSPSRPAMSSQCDRSIAAYTLPA